MKIVEHKIEVVFPSNPCEWEREAKFIEMAARTCYKSAIPSDKSWKTMVKNLKEKQHGAMLEFGHFMCLITTDRGVSHELVRHRIASYAQESTRYCNYSKDKFGNEITVVKPVEINEDDITYGIWLNAMKEAEASYFAMIEKKAKPENARSVLPTCLKTEIWIKCNWRELIHIINLRTAKDAHPDIQYVINLINDECQKHIPEVFGFNEGYPKTWLDYPDSGYQTG